MLRRFYAVTLTSVYAVYDRKGDQPHPYIEKLACRSESKIAVGETMGSYGSLLAIARWLQFFIPEGSGWFSPTSTVQRNLEAVNTRWWLENTSHIVALFTSKERALRCLKAANLEECDPRWRAATKKVLTAIGDDHPAFVVCTWGDLALLPAA